MKTLTKRGLIFATVCAASTGLGWLSGYNFDHRGVDVAIWAGVTFFFAGWFALYPFCEARNDPIDIAHESDGAARPGEKG